MQSLFKTADRHSIESRLAALPPGAQRQWGKMSVAQMLAHCSVALEVATGEKPRRQALIGKIFAPFVKSSYLGEKPFPKNSPTDPAFVVTDDREFGVEKQRLGGLVRRFSELGPEKASANVHSFFGRLSGDEWGVMMCKHLDHHFRQFGG